MSNGDNGHVRPRSRSTPVAYLQLVRLPNIFTAMADVAMGFLVVHAVAKPVDAWVLGLLVATSSLLYASGVVLNDVFDYRRDAVDRPERPLPSGRISVSAARGLGWMLLVLALAPACGAGILEGNFRPVGVAALLAGCVVLYNAVAKRTLGGPVVMGACRMLNVLLGMSVARQSLSLPYWLIAGGIGVYIIGVTWFARTEARQSNRLQLALALVVMMSGIAMLACLPYVDGSVIRGVKPHGWPLLIGVLGALIGWRCLLAVFDPKPLLVQIAVKMCILSLIMLDAAVCLACYAGRSNQQAMLATVLILMLLLPAMVLGQWIDST